jgi:hypothetical protein
MSRDWRVYRTDELLDRLRRLPSQEVASIVEELEVRWRRRDDEVDDLTRRIERLERELSTRGEW